MSKSIKTKIGAIVITIATAVGALVYNPTITDFNQPTPKQVNYNSHKLTFAMWHTTGNQANSKMTGEQVARFHTKPIAEGGRGWKKPGYNVVVETNGRKCILVPFNDDDIIQSSERANGAGEFNGITLHFSYIGGIDKKGKALNTLNAKQDSVFKYLFLDLVAKHPDILIVGHNQVCRKPCPCFNVPQKLRSYGIPDKNIWWWNNIYPEEQLPETAQPLLNTLINQPD